MDNGNIPATLSNVRGNAAARHLSIVTRREQPKENFFRVLQIPFWLLLICNVCIPTTVARSQTYTGQLPKKTCCTLSSAIGAGERISYKVLYHWHFVWLDAGEVTFRTGVKDYYGHTCYYITAEGHTFPKYDHFYKVRDTATAFIDTANFLPMRFYRSSHEGPTVTINDNIFDNAGHKVYYLDESKRNNFRRDSVHIQPSTMDIVTAAFYTRHLYFSGGNNDTTLLKIYLDGKVYNVHLRYLGKQTISSDIGNFKCEKLAVNLIGGTIFREGEQMTVWATDDANHLPLLVEAPIIVGSIRVELSSFSNLRNSMDAKVK